MVNMGDILCCALVLCAMVTGRGAGEVEGQVEADGPRNRRLEYLDPYLVKHDAFLHNDTTKGVSEYEMTFSKNSNPFRAALSGIYDQVYKGCDGEALDALEHYFWKAANGTVMEIGAVDGMLLSQSLPFMQHFGWRRILVEANPVLRDRLQSLPGKVWAVNAAICENATNVHYRALKSNDAKFSLTGGIIEFMSNRFARKMHNVKLMKDPVTHKAVIDYEALARDPNVHVIQCLPLKEILSEAQVTRVNLFVLDVEGGELSILHRCTYLSSSLPVLPALRPSLHRSLAPSTTHSLTSPYLPNHTQCGLGYHALRRTGGGD